MDSTEFKKDFIESIKTAAAVTGEGSYRYYKNSEYNLPSFKIR